MGTYDLDFNDPSIQNLLNNSDETNVRILKAVSKGIHHFRDKSYVECIKEIFREIKEISEFHSYEECHTVRNVLEHQPPYADWGRRFNKLFSEKFAYTYTLESYTFNIDFDSPQNKLVLQEMASKLIHDTRKYLNLI